MKILYFLSVLNLFIMMTCGKTHNDKRPGYDCEYCYQLAGCEYYGDECPCQEEIHCQHCPRCTFVEEISIQ